MKKNGTHLLQCQSHANDVKLDNCTRTHTRTLSSVGVFSVARSSIPLPPLQLSLIDWLFIIVGLLISKQKSPKSKELLLNYLINFFIDLIVDFKTLKNGVAMGHWSVEHWAAIELVLNGAPLVVQEQKLLISYAAKRRMCFRTHN